MCVRLYITLPDYSLFLINSAVNIEIRYKINLSRGAAYVFEIRCSVIKRCPAVHMFCPLNQTSIEWVFERNATSNFTKCDYAYIS